MSERLLKQVKSVVLLNARAGQGRQGEGAVGVALLDMLQVADEGGVGWAAQANEHRVKLR